MKLQVSRLIFGPVLAAIVSLCASLAANATLVVLGSGQEVEDTSTGLVWLRNANLGTTNTFGVPGITAGGQMSLFRAREWIAAMNAANYLGHDDWRLPVVRPQGAVFNFGMPFDGSTDVGVNITSPNTELAYLMNVSLGNLNLCPYNPINPLMCGPHAAAFDPGPFLNVRRYLYWTGTAYVATPGYEWVFDTASGAQYGVNENINVGLGVLVWAVRDASKSSAVSEPASIAIVLAGCVIGHLCIRRRCEPNRDSQPQQRVLANLDVRRRSNRSEQPSHHADAR